jgi:O-antigen/teichoic acid export membrane protein
VVSRLFTSACTVLTSFISLKLYSLYLTKEIYGVILVGVQIISYLPLTGAGFIMVLNQRILTDRNTESAKEMSWFAQLLQNYFFLFAVVVALTLMAGYCETSLVRTSGLPVPLFLCIGMAGAITFYMSGQLSFLIGQGEQVKCYFFQGIMSLLGSLILYCSFAAGWGVWAFPISASLSALLIFLPVRYVLRARISGLPLFVLQPKPDFLERLKKIWRPALDCLMTQGWGMLSFSLDTILVGLIVGPGPAAIYGVISRVTGISRHVLQALGEASWPRLAQQANPELKARFMRKVDRLNAWNVGCWFGTMFATVLPFMGWLLKADWLAGPLLVALVLTRHAIISLAGPHVFGITSLGLFKENARLARLEVITSVIPAVILSYLMGSVGTAIGYLIGTLCVSAWQVTRLYFVSNNQPWIREWCALYIRGIFGALLAYTLAAVLWRGCHSLWPMPGWAALIVGGIALGLSWAATAGIEMWRTHFNPLKD